MNIIKTDKLSELMTAEIISIVKGHDKEYHLVLYFDFTDDRCMYYLYYEHNKIVSVIALFEIDVNIYEVIAYTDINYRRQGCFTRLYNYVIQDLDMNSEISFLCEKDYFPATNLANKLSLHYECTEMMMEFDLTSYNGEDIPEINISVEANNKFFVFYKDTRIGSFNFYTFTFDINAVYFHSFNIYKKYRNRGLGKISMSAILLYLKNSGKTKIYLQLLLENTPAFKIYTKLGFKTASEISYYKKCHSLKTE